VGERMSNKSIFCYVFLGKTLWLINFKILCTFRAGKSSMLPPHSRQIRKIFLFVLYSEHPENHSKLALPPTTANTDPSFLFYVFLMNNKNLFRNNKQKQNIWLHEH